MNTTRHQHTTAGWATAWTDLLRSCMHPTVLAEGRALLDGAFPPLQAARGTVSTRFATATGTLRARIRVPVLTHTQWDTVYDAIASQPDIVTSARTQAITDLLTNPRHSAGIAILPTSDELAFSCPCQTGNEPCPHTAALGHMIANRIRTAPAILFTLRGRAHQHLKTHLRRTTTTPSPTRPSFAATMPAQEARLQPLAPPPIPPSSRMPTVPVLDRRPPKAPAPFLPTTALNAIVEDAAARAAALLGGTTDHGDDETADLARFISSEHGAPYSNQAAEHLGISFVQMRQLAEAHRFGGRAGVHAARHITHLDPEVLAQAEEVVQPLRPSPYATLAREGNRLTDAEARIQLRFGPDGRWYPYVEQFGAWRVAPGGTTDPAAAYRAGRLALRRR